MHGAYNWLKFMEHSRFYGFISIKAIKNRIKKINKKLWKRIGVNYFFKRSTLILVIPTLERNHKIVDIVECLTNISNIYSVD
jgi:hypothetical protein